MKKIESFHHNIIIPGDDLKIARYFNYEKLKDLLDSKKLWFSNADNFEDNNERKIPDSFFKDWSEKSKEGYLRIKNAKDKVVKAYITCWTEFDAENYALWKIYDRESNGICLVTTVGKLKKALDRTDMIICKVRYYDNEDKGKIDIPWLMYENKGAVRVSEAYKIKPYKYEQEIRGIIYDSLNNGGNGFVVPIDLFEIAEKIIISPFANEDTVYDLRSKLSELFNPNIISDSIIDENK